MFGRRRQLTTLRRACDLLHRDAPVSAPEVVQLGDALVLRVRLTYDVFRVVSLVDGRWVSFDVHIDERTGEPLMDELSRMAGLAAGGPLFVARKWDAHEIASVIISELVAYWDLCIKKGPFDSSEDRHHQYAVEARATVQLEHE